jgi:lipid-binding SYLF domain-containing protein
LRSIAEAAYELALRAIDQQERRLNELRSRTGTLIAAASVAASFLGAPAARSSDLDLAGGLAVLGYLVSVGAALYVRCCRIVSCSNSADRRCSTQ